MNLLVLLALVLFTVGVQGSDTVSCKGPSGQDVEWWILYQYDLIQPFSYADSSNPAVFDVPAKDVALSSSPLFRTVEQLFTAPEKPSYLALSRRQVSSFFPVESDGDELDYNTADGFPIDTTSSNPDILLGAVNRKSGGSFVENSFGIFHSDPTFPPLRSDKLGIDRPSTSPKWPFVAQPSETQSLFYFCSSFKTAEEANNVMSVFSKRMTYIIANSSKAEGTGSDDFIQSLVSLTSFGDASDACLSSLNKTLPEAQSKCVQKYELQGAASKVTYFGVSREFTIEVCLKESLDSNGVDSKLDTFPSWERPDDYTYDFESLPNAGLFAVTSPSSYPFRTVCVGSPLSDQQSGGQKSTYGSVLLCMKHQELWRRFFNLGLTFSTNCDMGPLENLFRSSFGQGYPFLGQPELEDLQEAVEEKAAEASEAKEERIQGPLTTLPGSTLRSTLTLPKADRSSGGNSEEQPKTLKVVMFQGGKTGTSGSLFAVIADTNVMFVDFGGNEEYFQQAMSQLVKEFSVQEKDVVALVSSNYDDGYINGAFDEAKTDINDVLKAIIASRPSSSARKVAINNFYEAALSIAAEMLFISSSTNATVDVGGLSADEEFSIFSQALVNLKLVDDAGTTCWSIAGAKEFSPTDPLAWPKYGQRSPRLASEVAAVTQKRSARSTEDYSAKPAVSEQPLDIVSKNGHIHLDSINPTSGEAAFTKVYPSHEYVPPNQRSSYQKKKNKENTDFVDQSTFHKKEQAKNVFGSHQHLLHHLTASQNDVEASSDNPTLIHERNIEDYNKLIPGLELDPTTKMQAVNWFVGEDSDMEETFKSVKLQAANPSKIEFYCIGMRDLVLSDLGLLKKYQKEVLAVSSNATYADFADRNATIDKLNAFGGDYPLNGANYTAHEPAGAWVPAQATGDEKKIKVEDPSTGEEALANTLDWNSIAFYVTSAEDDGPTIGLFSSSSMPQPLIQDRTTVATAASDEDQPLANLAFMVVPKFGYKSHNPEIFFQRILARYYFVPGSNVEAFQPSFETLKAIVDARRPLIKGVNPCKNNDAAPNNDFYIVLSNNALYDEDGCSVLNQLMVECRLQTMNVWSNIPSKMEVCQYSPACRKYSLGFATIDAETPQDVEGVYFSLDVSFTSKKIDTEGSFGGEKGSAIDCNGAITGKKGKVIRPCTGINKYEEKANGSPTSTVASSCDAAGKVKNDKASKALQDEKEKLGKAKQSKANDERLKAIEKELAQIDENKKKIETKIADGKAKALKEVEEYENEIKKQ